MWSGTNVAAPTKVAGVSDLALGLVPSDVDGAAEEVEDLIAGSGPLELPQLSVTLSFLAHPIQLARGAADKKIEIATLERVISLLSKHADGVVEHDGTNGMKWKIAV